MLPGLCGEGDRVTWGGTHVVWEGIAPYVIESGVWEVENRLVPQSPGEKSPTEEKRSEGLGPDARGFPSSTRASPLSPETLAWLSFQAKEGAGALDGLESRVCTGLSHSPLKSPTPNLSYPILSPRPHPAGIWPGPWPSLHTGR